MKRTGFAWYQLSRREAALTGCIGILLLALSAWAIITSPEPIEIDPCGKSAPLARIFVNRASVSELMTLPGIGERKAQRIVDARESGSVHSLEELAVAAGGLSAANRNRMRKYVAFDQ